jgi:murein DD-endopeptidase MepM/ murein hydrolase activator NlpD
MKLSCVLLSVGLSAFAASSAFGQGFRYEPVGKLVTGSGSGMTDPTVFAPDMRFPYEAAPVYANSQVWRPGGQKGGGGGQCHRSNYGYPWQDNFCESRGYTTPSCPSGKGHQGQDIRPATCEKDKYWAVAVEDGIVDDVGIYTVSLLGSRTGNRYRYLHMNMNRLAVREGDRVTTGQRLGLVSNFFGRTSTTIHLHFEVHQNVRGRGFQPVSPYMSLVRAYERLVGP